LPSGEPRLFVVRNILVARKQVGRWDIDLHAGLSSLLPTSSSPPATPMMMEILGLALYHCQLGNSRAQTKGDHKRLSTDNRVTSAIRQSERDGSGADVLVTFDDSFIRSNTPSQVCASGAKMTPPSRRQLGLTAVYRTPNASLTHRTSGVVSAMAAMSSTFHTKPVAHIPVLNLFSLRVERSPLDSELRDTVSNDIKRTARNHLCPNWPFSQYDEIPTPQSAHEAHLSSCRRHSCFSV